MLWPVLVLCIARLIYSTKAIIIAARREADDANRLEVEAAYFCFIFPSAFDSSLKLYFSFSFFLFFIHSSLFFSPFYFSTPHIHIVLFFKWSKNWGNNGIKYYILSPFFSKSFILFRMVSPIQQHNQQGLKPWTKRSSRVHAPWWVGNLRLGRIYLHWVNGLLTFFGVFFFLFSFIRTLRRTVLTCWRAYIHSNRSYWLICAAAE